MERRRRPDRRRRPTPLLSRYTLRGRRRAARRGGEARGLYVDRISPGVAWPLLLIFLFHCVDAVMTLLHVERGGRELNPLMSALIRTDPHTFVVVKLGVALAGLLFLGLHQNFPHVRKGIAALFLAFLGVVVYHVVLIARVLGL